MHGWKDSGDVPGVVVLGEHALLVWCAALLLQERGLETERALLTAESVHPLEARLRAETYRVVVIIASEPRPVRHWSCLVAAANVARTCSVVLLDHPHEHRVGRVALIPIWSPPHRIGDLVEELLVASRMSF